MADLLEKVTDEVVPGYRIDPETGAWVTLPWPGDPSLPLNHPERLALLPPSLGPQIILWGEHWLIHHLTGGPWRLTAGQKRFLHMWYSIDPKTGRYVYRSGAKRGAKGTGKDPFQAFIANAEMCGPVEFAGFAANGMPAGRPRRLGKVQLAANSLTQAKEVLEVANAMLSPQLIRKLNIDRGMTRTLVPSTGSKIEVVTSAESSNEGAPTTASLINESHHMLERTPGAKAAEVARRNVAKSPSYIQARSLEFTNAHLQGENSVAEQTYEAWQEQVAGLVPYKDILYDSVEYDPRLNILEIDQLRIGLQQAYSDAPWKDPEDYVPVILDRRTTPGETVRFYLNGLGGAEDSWVDPAKFDARARPDIIIDEGEKIAMFLDCSKSTDATTLSACRLSDGHVISLGGWRRPHGARGADWLAPREVVDAVVREAFSFYDVVWFGVDPSPAQDDEAEHLYWIPTIDAWHRDFQKKLKVWATPGAGGHSVLFDMRMSQPGAVRRNQRFTEAAMQTSADIEEDQTLTHDGDAMLRAHVHNARRRPNQWGVSLGKINRSSDKLVDYAVTMVGARMGRQLALRSSKVNANKRKGARLLN